MVIADQLEQEGKAVADGINAACAAALMSHYFLHDLGPKSWLGEFLQGNVPGQWASTV